MSVDVNANFTPSIPDSGVVPTKLPYNPTGSFKFWAQKILPLVYDDSLSYYEVLCKVVDYLNNVIQNVDNLNDSVDSTNQSFATLEEYVNTTKDALINAYDELQSYVNTYFDNLDVQDEINEKLDEMADSGALTEIISPFIPGLVTAWLAENVNPVGSAVVVDSSLSITGAAADAKATGDIRSNLESSEFITTGLNANLETGYIKTDGTQGSDSNWRCTPFIKLNGTVFSLHLDGVVDLSPSVGFNVAFFNANKRIMASDSVEFAGASVHENYTVPSGAKYVRISSTATANWSSGKIYQYLSNIIANDIKELNIISKHEIGGDLEEGYVKADGTFSTNSSWARTDYIKLEANAYHLVFPTCNILSEEVGMNIAYFDVNKSFIRQGSGTYSGDHVDEFKTIPNGAVYVIFSSTAVSDWEHAYIECFSAYNAVNYSGTIYVAKDGSGDYDTVTEAVANAPSGSIIMVKPGEYTDEHIEGWGKSLQIIGENPESTIISCDDSTYENPCIEFSVGVLKNLTFKKLNSNTGSGYAMHVEDDYQYGRTMFVENCIFISPTGIACGMGMRGGCKIRFKDCQFVNQEGQGASFYLHDSNNNSYLGIQNIDFENCSFFNLGNYILQLQSQEKENSTINIGFKDCTFYGQGRTPTIYISATNYYGGTGESDDFLGLINWRLRNYSTRNNFSVLNVLPTYTGTN